jgi:class 3 adenylate cyclase/pimeloyl-ACP methyl ester carboxylesterase
VRVPDVAFADAKGVRIAWQQWGSGPDVLALPPLVSNIQVMWENEFYRRFFEYVGRHVRLTMFDNRGMGLSDKFKRAPTLEQRSNDVVAVMNAAGLERPALLGVSEGGLMAQLFTVHHPDRVNRLALVNTHPGVSGMLSAFRGSDGSLTQLKQFVDKFTRIVADWGRDPQYCVDVFCPSNAANAAFVRWWGRLQRQSATPADIGRQVESLRGLDAGARLAEMTVPALVVHASGDRVLPVACGRYVADRIPGARFMEVAGDDHFVEPGFHWQHMADAWLEFVTGAVPTRQAERRVVTILFTDIVDSTKKAATVGDGEWRRLLDCHDRIAWELVDRHRGTIVKSTGDGVLARFDAPSQGLEFAVAFRQALAELAIEIRCGLHSGEVEVRDDGDIAGTAVNLAARVEQAADQGVIAVSSTVRDLVLGGDKRFRDYGEHSLKGFDQRWHLFALSE